MSNFEARVEEKLDRLVDVVADVRVTVANVAAKMDFLVGADGTNGLVGEHDARLKQLERRRASLTGALGAVGALVGGGLEWLGHRLFRGGH